MVRLATNGRRRLEASPVELRRRGPSFTYDTVRIMRRRYPGRDLRFIVGADALREIPTWHRWRDLVRAIGFIVVSRPGYRLRPLRGFADRFRLVPIRGLRLSATGLRARLRRGQPVGRALDPRVRAYIRRAGLYRA
jgi:nicotinate-nucleotide adenylyltransferase